jgi:uncharacterized protein (DUF2126 family)
MKVYGYQITDQHIVAAAGAVTPKGFVAREVQAAVERVGVPSKGAISMRVTDRLLQQWKRDGLIEFQGGKWYPVNPREPGRDR